MQAAQRHQHVPAIFPSVHASNLNRRTFDLPHDFEGDRNLVVVAFQRDQQEVVDTWTAPIRDLLARYPDLRFYELPTISRGNPLFRAWLDGAMRGGIPDHQSREQTITLYVDKVAFRRALGLPHEDTIYVLLVDRAGHVFWRGEGEYSARVAAELEPVLAGTAQPEVVPSAD
jgi:ATP synthase subunit 10